MLNKQLKLGWGLILIWFIALSAVVVNYHETEAKMIKVEQLGDSIDEFRSRLFFDAPYRIHLVEQQVANLNHIEALHDELAPALRDQWLAPDIQQLLFTTEWFVEQSRAFVDTELALVALIDQVQEKRIAYIEQPEMVSYYYRLSAYVFEALFSSKSAASIAYRDLDNLYTQSLSLAPVDKQQLQVTLANTSQVMGSYAQGSYLVSQLVSHSVHSEVIAVEDQYHRLLAEHLIAGAVLSGVVILLLMALWHNSHALIFEQNQAQPERDATQEPAASTVDEEERSNHDTFADAAPHSLKEPSSPEESLPQKESLAVKENQQESAIDFALMLDSLGNDRESLCMLLEVFVEDHQHDVATISRLLNDAPDEAIRKAHSLKGVGGNLGAGRLRDIAGKVEEAIQNDSTQVAQLLVTLDTHLSQAIKEAQDFLTREA